MKRLVLVAVTILISLTVVLTESAQASARGDPSIYDVDINHSSTFWGIAMDSDSCGGTPPVGTCTPTPAWHIRAALAYLIDKAQIVAALGLSLSNVIDNVVPASSYYTTPAANPWYLDWSSGSPSLYLSVDTQSAVTGQTGLYNIGAGPDFCAATRHLVLAAGIGNDGMPWHDTNSDCVIDNPPTQLPPVRFLISSTMPRRLVGDYLASQINTVFGASVVASQHGSIGVFSPIVFNNSPPDDWELYTGSFSVSGHPDWLCSLYYYDTGTNFPSNYIFYNVVAYDGVVVNSSCGSPPPLNKGTARFAEGIFGFTIGAIPVFWQ